MIRGLLFILFLYVLLTWVIVAYLFHEDPTKLVEHGFLWTAIGVASLLLWLILERVIGWWRVRRAQKTARPVKQAGSAQPVHEDDLAMASLLNEANQRLAQAPSSTGIRSPRALDLPLYLVVGPERAGKTAVMHHCGLEPSLLAGQVLGSGGPVTSTRVANLWLANESVFLELAGRIFNSDPERFAKFLSVLQPSVNTKGWKSWFRGPQKPILLRGALLVFDSKEFVGTPEPSKLDRVTRQIRERLAIIAEVFKAEFPVYVMFSNIDALPHFTEFFARLGEGESGQVFGVMTQEESPDQNQVWAEAETKRLNRRFQTLFLRLSDCRLMALTKEQDAGRKQAIYEFPREFKKIRMPLVQFLVDLFKPDPLKAGPRLRGFFFTGVRKTERLDGPELEPQSVFRSFGTGSQPTRMFEPDMGTKFLAPTTGSGPLVDRWVFVNDFFQKVLSQDRPAVRIVAAPSKLEQNRQIIVATAAGLALLSGLVWTVSWFGNRSLVARTQAAIEAVRRGPADLSLESLQLLDRLREHLVELERNNPLSLHWGLYTGGGVKPIARAAYFERLRQVSLNRINQVLGADMQQAGSAGTGPTYERLKTHLTITKLACPVDETLISKVLNQTSAEAHSGLGDRQAELLRTQLAFYASQLAKKELPVQLSEDPVAVEKATAYLRQAGGLEQQVRALINELNQQMKTSPVKVDDYAKVLTGAAEFPNIFTTEGLSVFKDRLAKGNFQSAGEECVLPRPAGSVLSNLGSQAREQMESIYYRLYADEWRRFLGSYNVIPFSRDNAARKLDILDGSRVPSPLLGVVKLIAKNTNLASTKPAEPGLLEKGAQTLGFGQSKSKAEKAIGQVRQYTGNDSPLMTAADVSRLFQPVWFTTPADQDLLVNEHNEPYIKGLRGLGENLDKLAQAPAADQPAAIIQAQAALQQAKDAHAALRDKFSDVEGMNKQLSDLLYQPIRWAELVIPKPAKPGAKKDGELAAFCKEMRPILMKYPFKADGKDADLDDFKRGFAPNAGLVSKYVQGSGADLVVRSESGQEWKPNPGSKDMKPTPELVTFLTRTQQVTSAFFGEGRTTPQLTYTLRRGQEPMIGFQLILDGKPLDSQDPLRRTFVWPGQGADVGGKGILMAGGSRAGGFGSFPGLWGVFKLFQIADERSLGNRKVQWSKNRGVGGGEAQILDPPAKVEFSDFPGGVDIFNPRFFDALQQCPKRAVVPE